MAFSIRNDRVEEKARAYAAKMGVSLTGALELALDKAAAIDTKSREREYAEWKAFIRDIQAKVAQSSDTGRTEQDVMGWDENGLPT
jgi:antitoxin VapB